MKIYYKNNEISINAKKLSFFGRVIGLMFKLHPEKTENLLFDFGKKVSFPIHSWFVFFKFMAVWMDKNNRVIEWKIVKPFRFSVRPKIPFNKLIEMPLNNKNREIISFFVGSVRKI